MESFSAACIKILYWIRMNYNRIYMSIVLLARADYVSRRAMHKSGMYFEMHHILPKSVGGSDNATNKVRYTGDTY